MARNIIGKFHQDDGDATQTVFRECHFSGEGRCRYDRDRAYRGVKPIGATVRINDYWICNFHYEHGYDRQLRSGERVPIAEQKRYSRLFGYGDDEARAEREAIQAESRGEA